MGFVGFIGFIGFIGFRVWGAATIRDISQRFGV